MGWEVAERIESSTTSSIDDTIVVDTLNALLLPRILNHTITDQTINADTNTMNIFCSYAFMQCDGSSQVIQHTITGSCYVLCVDLGGYLWAGWADWDPLTPGIQC